MSNKELFTLYAPAQRCDEGDLRRQVDYFNHLPVFKQGLDATNGMILILNSCRQAVFANKALLKMIKKNDVAEIVGERPGEIIQCIHAFKEINGCGTSEACKYCNAVNSVLKTMETNEESSGDFFNTNRLHGYEKNMNLSIHVAPLQVEQENFYVLSFTDNSDSVQKRLLERMFFHDIINTAGALKGIIGLLKDEVPALLKPEMEFVEKNFEDLVEEIEVQKYILDAENDQLVLEGITINTIEVLTTVSKLYEGHSIADNKTIVLDGGCDNQSVRTDYRLLRRILGNMIKNALEASDDRGIVTLGCNLDGDKGESITFWVHNNQYMEARVRSLVFHRSFSTKGTGRGIGTYSMKLLGEKFLQGKVDFSTSEEKGTTFYIRLSIE